jgi:DNA replication and repair protein RecF
MRIQNLSISNLRIFSQVELTPAEDLNLIVGPNASGKTSLLEGIHLLGVARSFRTSRIAEVIRKGTEKVAVRAKVAGVDDFSTEVRVEKERRKTLLSVGGKRVQSTSALAAHLPIVVITPESHNILHGGPRERRRLLDWTLFHVKHNYLSAWHGYQRALQQRNRLLRVGGGPAELAAWEKEMDQFAGLVHMARAECVDALSAPFTSRAQEMGLPVLSMQYRPGWDIAVPLAETLAQRREDDVSAGTTRQGPHRADIRILEETSGAAASVSRGQSKLIVAALLAANAGWLAAQKDVQPILLVDDFGAELDVRSRDLLGELIADLGMQTFVTATSVDQLPSGAKWGGLSQRVFHVKQGVVDVEMV